VPRHARLALLPAERAGGEEPAEVPVAGAILDEEMERARVAHDDVRADDRAHAGALGRLEEARRAVESVSIRERDRIVPERRGARDEILRQRRTGEERERAPAAKLDVVGCHHLTSRSGGGYADTRAARAGHRRCGGSGCEGDAPASSGPFGP